MDDTRTEKRDIKVNAFKAPEEWYEMVKVIAKERHTTINSAIIYLVYLGIPLYGKVKEGERSIIAEAVANYKTKEPSHTQKKSSGKR